MESHRFLNLDVAVTRNMGRTLHGFREEGTMQLGSVVSAHELVAKRFDPQ
jgi:hypothetical protein